MGAIRIQFHILLQKLMYVIINLTVNGNDKILSILSFTNEDTNSLMRKRPGESVQKSTMLKCLVIFIFNKRL